MTTPTASTVVSLVGSTAAKMVSMVSEDKEEFLKLSFDIYLEEAQRVGRDVAPADAIAIGGGALGMVDTLDPIELLAQGKL